jgi:hypothetical protein
MERGDMTILPGVFIKKRKISKPDELYAGIICLLSFRAARLREPVIAWMQMPGPGPYAEPNLLQGRMRRPKANESGISLAGGFHAMGALLTRKPGRRLR